MFSRYAVNAFLVGLQLFNWSCGKLESLVPHFKREKKKNVKKRRKEGQAKKVNEYTPGLAITISDVSEVILDLGIVKKGFLMLY